MFSHYNKHFDVYKYQKMLRQENTYEKLFNKIQSIYLSDGMTEMCEFLKISGILITNDLEFNRKLLLDISNVIVQDLDIKEKELWNTFKDKVTILNKIEKKFYADRNEFFDKLTANKNVTGELLIIAAEYIMVVLSNPLNSEIEYSNGEDSIENRMNTYDCYIGFISNVIKYFLYNKLEFKVSSKIFKKEAVNIATKHFHLDASWDLLMDIKEYFMFSTVSIENSNDKYVIEIVDEKFDKSVIISNFREKNYMNSTHDALNFKLKLNEKNKTVGEKNKIISIIQAERMLGVENMNEKIKKVSLKHWMSGYFFIKKTSENYLNSSKKTKQFKLTDMCVVKEKNGG